VKKLLLLISLSLIICACNKSTGTHNRLSSVENFVGSDSYHAFTVLDSLAALGINNAADTALYNLLYLEALHNVGLYTQDDSMIAVSQKYYEHKNDKRHLAYSYLHHGISLIYNHKLLKAIQYIKKSELLASNISDNNLRRDVYENLGRANNEAECNELALKNYKASLCYCDSITQRERYAQCLNNLAKVYKKLGITDSFMLCTAASMRLFNSSQLKAEVLANIADYYFHKGNINKARYYANKTMLTGNVYIAARTLGDICYLEGDKFKATQFYYQAVDADDIETRIYSYRRLIDFYHDKGDIKRTLYLSERLNNEYQEYRKINPTEIANFQTNFDEQMKAASTKKRTVTLTVLILLLSLIIVTTIFITHRNSLHLRSRLEKINANYADYLQQYRELSQQLKALKDENHNNTALIAQKITEIECLQQKLSEYQDDKVSPESWNIENTLLNSDIVFHLHRLAARGKVANDIDWQLLNDGFNDNIPTFIPIINTRISLSQREQRVCELIRLRFIPSEIASLMRLTPQVVTNIRSHLLEKIFSVKGGAKQFDMQIRKL
jgi:DNA-binding NarL/FixJ family response regulator